MLNYGFTNNNKTLLKVWKMRDVAPAQKMKKGALKRKLVWAE